MPTRKTMNVSMTPELERSVAARIAAGRYRTASEVVRAALRLLDREEPIDGVRSPSEREGSDGHVSPAR
ncbi:type II toxin-antitoxin system ParD family antitoxin [Lichenifustis flavocetrariae]|uniref:Type II toxin-antitoxin system ParD family antitoxin n=1 Tax=Lichenifustis flavocetrariae TaxID=2949735 RepID=A0AA41Z3B6_9HYPH|nr:type II toxin-antitoxin system ParD family antitoxin [Lichenifustis flavocetrariae]MCW6512236.1 type II toxin-antitoxin system ParD family antitoxin [Lichenifustis flavocetrariae]